MRATGETDRTTREAADWLVALDENPDDAQLRDRFHAWLSAHHDHAEAWSHVADVYQMMAKLSPVYEERWTPDAAGYQTKRLSATKAYAAASAESGRSARRPVRWLAGTLAACMASLVFPTTLITLHTDFAHSHLRAGTAHLQDGSHVRIAPHSTVMSVLSDERRLVHVYRGRAFFDVSPDANRPFEVEAHKVKATVLGTAFEVQLGEQAATVGVRRGRVRVDYAVASASVSERLEPGDWVRVSWAGMAERGRTVPDEVALWTEGQLIVRDQRLRDVVEQLGQYYDGSIAFADERLGQRRVSGVYNLGDPLAAMIAAVGVHGGSLVESSEGVVIFPRR